MKAKQIVTFSVILSDTFSLYENLLNFALSISESQYIIFVPDIIFFIYIEIYMTVTTRLTQ